MKYMIRQMQLQKVYGEMNALLATFYNPCAADGGDDYPDALKVIEDMIEELGNNFG